MGIHFNRLFFVKKSVYETCLYKTPFEKSFGRDKNSIIFSFFKLKIIALFVDSKVSFKNRECRKQEQKNMGRKCVADREELFNNRL